MNGSLSLTHRPTAKTERRMILKLLAKEEAQLKEEIAQARECQLESSSTQIRGMAFQAPPHTSG